MTRTDETRVCVHDAVRECRPPCGKTVEAGTAETLENATQKGVFAEHPLLCSAPATAYYYYYYLRKVVVVRNQMGTEHTIGSQTVPKWFHPVQSRLGGVAA